MTYILEALILIVPALCIWCYRQGIRDGRKLEKGEELEKVIPALQRREAKESRETAEYRRILSNIDTYDGTNKGQVRK